VLVAFPESGAKIRQIAVDAPHRGRGIGSELLLRAEEAVRNRNIRSVTLHARVSALGFFEQRGYRAVSEVFTEVTIPHIAMEKDLTHSANGDRCPRSQL
jgi:ribosomal protein S18 acetylase RimI-like enzyme